MGLLGGGKKKKIPNSRKKGAVVKNNSEAVKTKSFVPELPKKNLEVASKPSEDPVIIKPTTTGPSVAERAKAFGAANAKPSEAAPKTEATTTTATTPSPNKLGRFANDKSKETDTATQESTDEIDPEDNRETASVNNKKFGFFGKGKSKGTDAASGEEATKEAIATDNEPAETSGTKEKKKFGLFGKGKPKEPQADNPTTSTTEKPAEPPVADKKKFGLFGRGKSKDTETDTAPEISADPPSGNDKEDDVAVVPGRIGKLSTAALTLNIPGLGGKSRGTDTESKTITGKPPPVIDIYAETEQNAESQGHAQMSDRARQTLVAPKETNPGKEDWKFLYELATQYDAYKQQEAEASKNQSKATTSSGRFGQAAAPPKPAPGDTKAIKNNLNNLFGGGGGPGGGMAVMNMNANGSFLNKKYFDQYLKEHSSGVALEFSNETGLYKRFSRKDQEQRTISEKFAAELSKHPKAKKITQLNMSGALLPDAFLVALCESCLSSGGLPLLQVLNLESNDLTREGFEALAKIIAAPKGWKRLQILKLENQKKEISAGAEDVLGDAIVQSPSLVQVGLRVKGGIPKQQIANTVQSNLDKLRVARRQHLAKKGKLKARKRNEMETLFDAIASNKDKKITEVDLTENLRFLGLDEHERTKTGTAFVTNKTVTKVTMTKLKLDDDFAEAFGKALAKNKTLETVVLDSNSFSAKGVKALLTGLGQNASVTNFQIRHQSKTLASSDEETLPDLLANNTTMVTLGTDVRNPLIKSKLDRKTNENREIQRKQRVAQKKR
mmetsp:Transcript_4717/g.12090  ORF Transcript_4717/g.12090 Transcript_4717/m.12090 type:complete len:782 (-) Transcript_4717:873-3218(-)